jgi:hypothetical protein
MFFEIRVGMITVRSVPCHSPHFHMVRTNVKGEPNQLNSLLPPCEPEERGSKVSLIIKVLRMGCPPSYSMFPLGERGQERTHPSYFLMSTPGVAETRRRQVKCFACK